MPKDFKKLKWECKFEKKNPNSIFSYPFTCIKHEELHILLKILKHFYQLLCRELSNNEGDFQLELNLFIFSSLSAKEMDPLIHNPFRYVFDIFSLILWISFQLLPPATYLYIDSTFQVCTSQSLQPNRHFKCKINTTYHCCKNLTWSSKVCWPTSCQNCCTSVSSRDSLHLLLLPTWHQGSPVRPNSTAPSP